MKRTDIVLLNIAIFLGGFLRLFRLGHQSIWGDEALTLQVYTVGRNLPELLANIWHRGFHPPLYFIIAHYWYLLGTSEFMLRFPSVVFGIAAIPMMYLVARRLFGNTAAGISALFIAISPFHIWYSQEARMYSLQVLLVLASTLFFLRAWETPSPLHHEGGAGGGGLDYLLYALTTLLALYTQIGTLFLVAAQGVYVLAAGRKQIAGWLGIQAIVILAFVPWLLRFMAHRSVGNIGAIGFERESGPLQLAYGLYTFSVGYSLGPSVAALHYLSPSTAIHQYLPVLAISAFAFGFLLILGLIHAYRTSRFGFWFVLSQSAVPLILILAASLLPGVGLTPRYLTVAIVPYWIIISLGIMRSSRAMVILPAAALILIGLSLHNHYFNPDYAKQDMRSAVAMVNREAAPGDVIIISSIELGGPFIYYFQRQDIPYYGYPPDRGLVNPADLDRDIERLIAGKKRAWLILGRTWSSDPKGLILAQFQTQYEVIETQSFQGVQVKCFRLPRTISTQTSMRTHGWR